MHKEEWESKDEEDDEEKKWGREDGEEDKI